MTLVSETVEPDARERLLVVAERLLRHLGYTKTTVADIAQELRLSPANVYRFFDSEKSTREGVCRILMGEVEEEAAAIMQRPGSASERLREMIKTVNRMNSERYVGDSKLHEMVEVAMQESWDVCVAHMKLVTETIGGVIAQGIASGEFAETDVGLAAFCTCHAMIGYFHPQMIAQMMNKPGATIDEMIDFVLASLVRRK